TCYLATPVSSERWPLLDIHIDEETVGTAFEVCQRLRQGTPPIYVGHAGLHEGMLTINPLCLTAENARILAARLCEELK
ncbi:MAG: selenocysteine synthase, partial [Planctomycetaceae bacterium]|nr:selenocysteine synthase [Planctomycetaceae bacterium]